jgi:uncharacterized RDD family membrane protein YckC
MQISCPRCAAILEYAERRPSFCSECGCPLTQVKPETTAAYQGAGGAAAEVPEAVGGYRLLRRLGGGGMGTVYEGEDPSTGRRVAVKLLAPEFAESADAVERFRREGRLAGTLAHERCVFVLAADEEAGRPYIVMELMPGQTLEDLVRREGPLAPALAITKILDVIEGLREAHKLGIVHRDVKPSNCFLEASGRVKVGDFGLSRSLRQYLRLTQTGAFVGTPLFAAPEQIKGEAVDQQADVYSVAATLYFLLTGRAPFEGGDAAATLARIVSESAPGMRTVRPRLDRELDAVVLRGLERNKARRWRDLGEFRSALLRAQPERLPIGGLAARFAAYLLDTLLFATLFWVVQFQVGVQWVMTAGQTPRGILISSWGTAVVLLYYTICEGLWGASLGKWLLGLRVCTPRGSSPPGLVRGLVRTLVFLVCVNLANVLLVTWMVLDPAPMGPSGVPLWAPRQLLIMNLLLIVGTVLGLGLLLGPMRTRNGYRGLHEFLSGTRVVFLPQRETPRLLPGRVREAPLLRPAECPERLGPFVVRGALRWGAGAGVLLGQDAVLGRPVWLWLRSAGAPPLSGARREVSRGTRWRWLACGEEAGWQWDAFVAVPGSAPLPELVAPGRALPWAEARRLLRQLADELAASVGEGLLPDELDVGHLWVLPDGTLQLVDIPLGEVGAVPRPPETGESLEEVLPVEEPAGRALALLSQAAVLMLEGRPRRESEQGPVRAPIPLYARRLLERLPGLGPPAEGERGYREVSEFQAGLRGTQDSPAEVRRARRITQLAVQAVFLWLGLGCCLWPGLVTGDMVRAVIRSAEVNEHERALGELDRMAAEQLALSAVAPDLPTRLRGVAQWQADQHLRGRLVKVLEAKRQRRDAVLASLSEPVRRQVEQGVEANREQSRAYEKLFGGLAGRSDPSFIRLMADVRSSVDLNIEPILVAVLLVVTVVPAVVWVVWAALWRGGLSMRVTGLALVRRDGRPAARWQCGWRALLVWGPVAALVVLAVGLDASYWLAWRPGMVPGPERAWASAARYAALGLLALYAVLAVAWPRRGLHDRLAGTYVVPR